MEHAGEKEDDEYDNISSSDEEEGVHEDLCWDQDSSMGSLDNGDFFDGGDMHVPETQDGGADNILDFNAIVNLDNLLNFLCGRTEGSAGAGEGGILLGCGKCRQSRTVFRSWRKEGIAFTFTFKCKYTLCDHEHTLHTSTCTVRMLV